MAVRGGAAGHGKSGAPLTRGCFLLVLFLLMMVMMVDAAHALSTTARQPDLPLGSFIVKFRGTRSALMHPTATSFSPPIKNNAGRRPPPQHLGGGSISSSLMPPGVASRTPSSRQQSPSPAAPALTPPPHALRPNTWMSGAGSRPPQSTFMGFGMDRVAALRPAKWSHPQTSATPKEGAGGWAGMDAPAMQASQVLLSEAAHSRPKLTSGPPSGRSDTFGLVLSEDLSHLDDRPSGRWQTKSEDRFRSRGEDRVGSREAPRTVFHGGFRQTHLWPTDEKEEEEELVEDEGARSLVDFNETSEYQREDYITYHDYHQSNHSWRSPEQNSSTDHNQEHLTFQHVMEMQNLASQADLHALLEQRGITFVELQALLDRGARKEDVLEFLKPPTPVTTLTTTTTTTTNPPVLSHSPSEPAASVIEEGHPDDITRQVTLSDAETEREGDDAEQDSREQNKKNRKKGRRGKGERRRKNKKRKGNKGQRDGVSDVVPSPIPPVNNKTPTVVPDPWVPSTPRTLPETTLAPTAATRDILLPTTQPPAPDTTATSPSSVKASEVSIVSVTLVEAPSDPHRKTPGQTTIVEGATPSRRHNTNTTYPWEEQNPRKIPHPVRPSRGPEQTELEEVNFVREEQRDDYVFPLRGLLIISGLMGALAVFTLVVLISYAVIKCSKKPAVNNYQVSEQQKPAGT